MAVYYFAKSPAYVSKTTLPDYRRREVAARHLKADYKAGKNRYMVVFEQIKAELEGMQIPYDLTRYREDKLILRQGYLYLIAADKEARQTVFNKAKASGGSYGINCLIQDGIQTWDQLKALVMPVLQPEPEKFVMPDLTRVKELTLSFSELADRLEAVLAENENLRAQLDRVSPETEELHRQLSDMIEYVALIEEHSSSLEESLRHAREAVKRSHASTLEEIARENPEFPRLTTIAQEIAAKQSGKAGVEALAQHLPKVFQWTSDSGKIEYRPQFFRAFADLRDEDRAQVRKQLETLSAQGPEYTSLYTKKSSVPKPYTPTPHFLSRGADDIRFTWTKNGTVVVYWVFRRGDTRVRQSEA